MSEHRFVLVTGNPNKVEEARRITGLEIDSVSVDLPEIQSLDLGEVLAAKGEAAWQQVGRPLVVEETGLELRAMGGFPGPLVRWMLEAMGPEGIASTAIALGETRATARCMLLYRDADTSIVAEGADTGDLVLPARGSAGFGWDPVFQPTGSERTWGEARTEEKDLDAHRGLAWRALLAKLDY